MTDSLDEVAPRSSRWLQRIRTPYDADVAQQWLEPAVTAGAESLSVRRGALAELVVASGSLDQLACSFVMSSD